MALLTYSQLNAITPLGPNAEATVVRLIDEVENTQMRDLLGAPFLFAVQDAPEDYIELLDGATFTNGAGYTVKQRGLRFVLAYLVKSEYVIQSAAIDTATGYAFKKRNEADPIDSRARRDLMDSARGIAESEFAIIRDFLNVNSAQYPLFTCKKPVFKGNLNLISIRKSYKR
jgi:hypothetical protein